MSYGWLPAPLPLLAIDITSQPAWVLIFWSLRHCCERTDFWLKGSFLRRNKEDAEKCNLTNKIKGNQSQDSQSRCFDTNCCSRGKLHYIYFHQLQWQDYTDITKCAVQKNFLWQSMISQHASLLGRIQSYVSITRFCANQTWSLIHLWSGPKFGFWYLIRPRYWVWLNQGVLTLEFDWGGTSYVQMFDCSHWFGFWVFGLDFILV